MTDEIDINNMNDEEFTVYITNLISERGINKYTYDGYTDNDEVFHEITYFKSSNGWEVRKEDLWQQ